MHGYDMNGGGDMGGGHGNMGHGGGGMTHPPNDMNHHDSTDSYVTYLESDDSLNNHDASSP